MIESAKVTFSKIGMHACQGHVGNMFMPRISMKIQGRKSAKTGYLAPGRFGKTDYLGLAILPDFIVIITTSEYITVGESIEEIGKISRADAGEIVNVQEDGFICKIGNKIQLRDMSCEVIRERELTEEELKGFE